MPSISAKFAYLWSNSCDRLCNTILSPFNHIDIRTHLLFCAIHTIIMVGCNQHHVVENKEIVSRVSFCEMDAGARSHGAKRGQCCEQFLEEVVLSNGNNNCLELTVTWRTWPSYSGKHTSQKWKSLAKKGKDIRNAFTWLFWCWGTFLHLHGISCSQFCRLKEHYKLNRLSQDSWTQQMLTTLCHKL